MAKEISAQELNTEDFIHEKVEEIQGIVSVTYNIAPKPPSTIEAV